MTSARKLAMLCLTGLIVARAADPPDSRDFFEKRVRPVFARNCIACHGATRMGGLDMASREGLLRGGASGPSIIPGNPGQSLLIQSVSHQHEKIRMPLQQARLADELISDLVEWVKAGAYWPEPVAAPPSAAKAGAYTITSEQRSFWSLQPIRKPLAPPVKDGAWPKTDIDRFLLAKMESKGARPAPFADPRTLVRRVYYDLTGLPPSSRQIADFVNDPAPAAWAKLVDRLLDSPRYGERWGRYWLDLARYSDDRLESEVDAPYANAFRYRDWVIDAFNRDLPFDTFVKAQLAGDLLGEAGPHKNLSAGLGFFGLRPDTQDDRVDATGRVFLGLTTGCAQCHNHKFDPIPTTDYYALQGVFESTENAEIPLAPEAVVKEYQAREKAATAKKAQIRDFLYAQAQQLAEMLASQTARYVAAVRASQGADLHTAADREKLDFETLQRWSKYLARGTWEHPFLKDWTSPQFDTGRFQSDVLAVWKERKTVDEENAFRRAEAKRKGPKAVFEPVSLKTESFYLWRDLFFNDFYGNQFKQEDDGLLYYGPNRGFYETDGTVERFLFGGWKDHLDRLRIEAKELRAQVPPQYPFLHAIKDAAKAKTERVHVGGNAENLGEEVPRRFLTALCDGEPAPFQQGSGRLELAEAIASAKNPLTARVIVNRIWHHHFGAGIVRTPSDFGFMGDRPSHPELLDYLAARFIERGWSMKALHREILLSAVYRLSAERVATNHEIDPENRLLWRANMRRLDAEAMRDSLLAVSGELDQSAGGPPVAFSDAKNVRRTVYGLVSRRKLDGTLSLFDFPNANATSEKRSVTITPTQQLFFLNSEFLMDRAKHLASRLNGGGGSDAAATLREAYTEIFGRVPSDREVQLGLAFARQGRDRWPLYVHALLTSNEFMFVN